MYVIYECTRIGREFVRENEFLKKIREGEWIFEIRREKERERKEEFLGKKSYWKSHLSLYLSLLINETNEKENVQELEENSKEREWIFEIRREREREKIFGQRIILRESFLSLSLSFFLLMNETNEKENVQKLQENSRKRKRERMKFEERERGGFLDRESYWASQMARNFRFIWSRARSDRWHTNSTTAASALLIVKLFDFGPNAVSRWTSRTEIR